MTRHINDHPKDRSGTTRTRMFLRMERRLNRRDPLHVMHRRPHSKSAARLREFLRIERGRLA